MRSFRAFHVIRQLFKEPYLIGLLLFFLGQGKRSVKSVVGMHWLSLSGLLVGNLRGWDCPYRLRRGWIFLNIEKGLRRWFYLKNGDPRCRRGVRRLLLLGYCHWLLRTGKGAMHGVLYGGFGCFLLLSEVKLVGIQFQPRVKLNDQIALIHLALQILLDLEIVFPLQGIVTAQMMIKLLEDDIELVFEILVLLRFGGPGVLEFCGEVEGGLEVLLDVGDFDVPEECIHISQLQLSE